MENLNNIEFTLYLGQTMECKRLYSIPYVMWWSLIRPARQQQRRSLLKLHTGASAHVVIVALCVYQSRDVVVMLRTVHGN